MWIKAVEGFDEAKREVSELARFSPGDYFIFDTRTGRVVARDLLAERSEVFPSF